MIYIVRHGESIGNINNIYGGRLNFSLTEKGKKQAKIIKNELKEINFDKVFSSPLIRALETAKIITNKEITIDERIIERSNGDLEGKVKKDIKEKIDFNDINETRYNIENIKDFRDRINNFLEDITTNYKNKNILIVTHAGVGIYMRCFFEGEPLDKNYLKYKMKNCEVIKYEV